MNSIIRPLPVGRQLLTKDVGSIPWARHLSTPSSSSTWKPVQHPHVVPPPLPVPSHIIRPSYVFSENNRPSKIDVSEYAQIKDEKTIKKMREAARIAREALKVR